MFERKNNTEWERYPSSLITLFGYQPEWEPYRTRASEASSLLFAQNGDTSSVEAIIPNSIAQLDISPLLCLLLIILDPKIALIDSAANLDNYLNTVSQRSFNKNTISNLLKKVQDDAQNAQLL
jgi:hypothetical protein